MLYICSNYGANIRIKFAKDTLNDAKSENIGLVQAIIRIMKELPFSERIKKLRELMALSQQEAADKLNISKRQLQKLESGVAVPKGVKLKKYLNEIEALESTSEKEAPSSIKRIPFYDMDVSASNIQMFDDSGEYATDHYQISDYEDCKFATRIFGHSMFPTYETGVKIFCKPILDLDVIAYGECHLIITDEHRMVKRILVSEALIRFFLLATTKSL